MALQSVANAFGLTLCPMPVPGYDNFSTQNTVMNAAGEGAAVIGTVIIPAGGSKTISSSGGKIHWMAGGVTWAQAGTSMTLGIQDVDTGTGLPDTTYDVSAALVPGTTAVTANSMNSHAMTSGSKTITHGDTVAIVWTMTARVSADSVAVRTTNSTTRNFAYSLANTGGGMARLATGPLAVTIEFDDGTVGFFAAGWALPCPGGLTGGSWGTVVAIDSGATPDEVALIFQVPFPTTLASVCVPLVNKAQADTLEVILYSDPLGTPAAITTVVLGANVVGASVTNQASYFDFDQDLAANTVYAIAVRPTSANPFEYFEFAFGSETNAMKATPLGANWYKGTRTDQTGAFSTTTSTIPNISLHLSAFDSGGGGGRFTGIIGGT